MVRVDRYFLLVVLDVFLLVFLASYSFHPLFPAEPRLASRQALCDGCNVVFVVFDSVRADHMSLYGYRHNTTPKISEFFKSGYVFENAYSASSWSKESVASIFTSLYPSVHGSRRGIYEKYLKGMEIDALSEEVVTLAESLSEGGYGAYAIVPNEHLKSEFGFGQGFDEYLEDDLNPWGRINMNVSRIFREAGGPVFLYIHYMTTHYPYNSPYGDDGVFYSPGERRFIPGLAELGFLKDGDGDIARIRAEYDAEILYADDIFTDLVSRVPENTLFIFTSDHGEELYEHGGMGHSGRMYEEHVHIPLMIRVPGLAGGRVLGPASHVDLMPTILDLVGVPRLDGLQGVSLVSSMLDGVSHRDFVFSEVFYSGVYRYMVVQDGLKLILSKDLEGGIIGYEAYNLSADPGEEEDLYDAGNPMVAGLKELLGRQMLLNRQHLNYSAVVRAEITRDSEERLRELGYLK